MSDADNEDKKPEAVVKAFQSRLTALKQAKDFASKGEVLKSVEKYKQYLGILAAYHSTSEESLTPKLFHPEKDITEMLLISHAYWDLAKAYDRNQKLHSESVRCLKQFILFTEGYKFQYVNAQMVRKFIKKKQAYNLPVFKEAYEKLRVKSKSCYIATYCYGPDSKEVDKLRSFRDKILDKHKLSRPWIELYYTLSPRFIDFVNRYPKVGSVLRKLLILPVLRLIINRIR